MPQHQPGRPVTRDPRERRCLRLRGLPFGATEEQVALFLKPCAEVEQVVVCRRDGKCTGQAFAVCASAAQASRAFSTLNKAFLGHRYVEVFNASPPEVDAAAAAAGGERRAGGAGGSARGGGPGRAARASAPPALGAAGPRSPAAQSPSSPLSARSARSEQPPPPLQLPSAAAPPHARSEDERAAPVARLSRVPRGVPPKALAAWLAPARLRGGAKGIHYELDKCGFSTGEAFVELDSDECLAAVLARDGQELGGSAVQVAACSLEVMNEILGLPARPPAPRPPPPPACAAQTDSGASSSGSSGLAAAAGGGGGRRRGAGRAAASGAPHGRRGAGGAGGGEGAGWSSRSSSARLSGRSSGSASGAGLAAALAGLSVTAPHAGGLASPGAAQQGPYPYTPGRQMQPLPPPPDALQRHAGPYSPPSAYGAAHFHPPLPAAQYHLGAPPAAPGAPPGAGGGAPHYVWVTTQPQPGAVMAYGQPYPQYASPQGRAPPPASAAAAAAGGAGWPQAPACPLPAGGGGWPPRGSGGGQQHGTGYYAAAAAAAAAGAPAPAPPPACPAPAPPAGPGAPAWEW